MFQTPPLTTCAAASPQVRWPSKELVPDRSQGAQSATIQTLARHWLNDYDWRRCEARLNDLPQFKTEIDDLDVHFIQVKSQHEDAFTADHDARLASGPSSSCSRTIGPPTDPTAHGDALRTRSDLVLPSTYLGYGFSGRASRARLVGR